MKSLLGQVLTVHDQTHINADYISVGQSSIQRRKSLIVDGEDTDKMPTNLYPLPDNLVLVAQSGESLAL